MKYGSESWTGYWSLCACVNRAKDEGVDLTDMQKDFDLASLKKIFRSDTSTEMPMIEDRLEVSEEYRHRIFSSNKDSLIVYVFRFFAKLKVCFERNTTEISSTC